MKLSATSTLFSVAAVATCVCLASATAPQQDSGDAIAIHSAGLELLLPSPKDRQLLASLRAADQAVTALLGYADGPPVPPEVVRLVFEILGGPMSLRAGMLEEPMDPDAGGPPIYLQFDMLSGTRDQALGRTRQLADLIAEMTGLSLDAAPDDPHALHADLDGARLALRPTEQGGRSACTLTLNRDQAVSAAPAHLGLPDGVKPAFAATFDTARLQPAIEQAMAMAGPEADLARAQLEASGVLGPNAMTHSMALGYGPDRGYIATRSTNYRKVVESTAASDRKGLQREALQRVPADATYAQVTAMDVQGSIAMLRRTLEQAAGGGLDPLAELSAHLGIDVFDDLLAHLGDVMGAYMSDASGGGLMSLVAFVQVTDEPALRRTIDTLVGKLNQMARDEAEGRVHAATATIDAASVTVLTFPGLPVPVQPALSLDRGYLYVAASIQTLTAAVQQGRRGSNGLLEHPALRAQAARIEGATQVMLLDTPRLMQSGYPLVSLATTALANATRSPEGPGETVLSVIPGFAELRDGARPIVHVSRIEGDDLVGLTEIDRSILVNACGAAGSMGGAMGAGILSGMLLPAIGKARASARERMAMANLRQIAMAAHVFAAEHDGQMPPDIATMLAAEVITPELLHSPVGPAPQGPDIWFDTARRTFAGVRQPDRQVLAYDRAMCAAGERVAVVFYDGHVQQMTLGEFLELTAEAMHEGIEFDVP